MRHKKLYLLVISSLFLSACGGSSGSNDNTKPIVPEPIKPEVTYLTGVASQGGGIRGDITSTANSIKVSGNKTLTQLDGKYSIDIKSLSTPSIIKIKGIHAGSDTEQYTLFLDGMRKTGVSNISPFTRLVISGITGVNAEDAFNNIDTFKNKLTVSALDRIEGEISQIIAPLIATMGIDNPSYTRNQYQANFTDIDAILSVLDIQFDETSATITYKPESNNTLILNYQDSWQGKMLLPNGIQNEDALESMKVIYNANKILEAMPLAISDNNEGLYNSYLHPDAHWFGVDKNGLYNAQKAIIGNETDEMDRFRDFQLTNIKDGAYLISYTERYQNNIYASAGRRQAWFKPDSSGEMKFLGDLTPLPTSTNAFLKYSSSQNGFEGDAQQSQEGEWLLEVDAFVSASDCQSITTPDFEWDYTKGHSDPSYVLSLPKIENEMSFSRLVITGAGLKDDGVTFDRVYRSSSKGTCHLVTSSSGLDPMTEGLFIENINEIVDGTEYTFTFIENDGSVLSSKVIKLGKGVQTDQDMKENYTAQPEIVHGEAGNFNYKWSRNNSFMVEADIWAYDDYSQPSFRIETSATETYIKSSDYDNIIMMFHTAFDPYGRVVTDNYFTKPGQAYLGQALKHK